MMRAQLLVFILFSLLGCAVTSRSKSEYRKVASEQIGDYEELVNKADSLVENIHKERDRSSFWSAYDFWNDTEIQLAFKSKYIDSIIAHGFLNLHQTGSSSAITSVDARTIVEDRIIGQHIEKNKSGNMLRPKYGYLGFKKSNRDFRNNYTWAYGDVIAVFQSENIKSRTTYTPNDSFGFSASDPGRTLKDRPSKLPKTNSYWEAQIWGPLKIQDVSYFLINCFSKENENPPVSKAVIAKLIETEIPVFECKRTKASNNDPEGDGLWPLFQY